jgi:hypothetical protein
VPPNLTNPNTEETRDLDPYFLHISSLIFSTATIISVILQPSSDRHHLSQCLHRQRSHHHDHHHSIAITNTTASYAPP